MLLLLVLLPGHLTRLVLLVLLLLVLLLLVLLVLLLLVLLPVRLGPQSVRWSVRPLLTIHPRWKS